MNQPPTTLVSCCVVELLTTSQYAPCFGVGKRGGSAGRGLGGCDGNQEHESHGGEEEGDEGEKDEAEESVTTTTTTPVTRSIIATVLLTFMSLVGW
jgi:hypothetical protein